MRRTILAFLIILFSLAVSVGLFVWQKKAIQKSTKDGRNYKIGLLQMAPIVSQNMDGFRAGLTELGYKEGKNITYIYRDANGDLEKLKAYAQELVALKPDLIFVNTSPSALAVKEATKDSNLPVVFSMVADPIGAGVVASKESSGNNFTGTSCAYIDIAPKRLEFLHTILPEAKKILVPFRREDKSAGPCTDRIVEVGKKYELEILPVEIKAKEDIEKILENLSLEQADAIMDPGDSMVSSMAERIAKRSLEVKVPYFALSKGEVEKGALAGYAVDYFDLGKQTAIMASQVLSGTDPSDIPFERPRRWSFAVNTKTMEALGLTIPPIIMEEADYLIK